MNAAHLHLMVNHAPVIGSFAALSLLAWAIVRKSWELQRAALLAWVGTGLAAVAAYVSGSFAEDLVQDLPGVSPGRISRHEEAAVWALVMMSLAGAWALFGLWRFRREARLPRWFVAVALVLALLCLSTVARTANLGGQIRHEEARPGWKTAAQSGGQKAEA